MISVIGLSHLGLSTLVSLASKGYNVIGFDTSEDLINNIKKLNLQIKEPGLLKSLKKYSNRIKFTCKISDIKKTKVTFISIDVPTNKKNLGKYKIVLNLINLAKKNLGKNSILVIMSQIPPGFMRKIDFPKERLFYQVETLIFGDSLKRASKPERIIIGTSDEKIKISRHYFSIIKKFKCPIIKTSYESAELTKISINMFLSSSVTLTNKLAEVSRKIGANWDQISASLKLDKRIGKFAYLQPGLGLSGGNLERDISTIIRLCNKNKINSSIFKNFFFESKNKKNWINENLKKIINIQNSKITILGVTYKKNTNSIKNSPFFNVIKKLNKKNTTAFDPFFKNNTYISNVKISNKYDKNLRESNIIIILTPHKEFKKINFDKIKFKNKKIFILDPYGFLKNKKMNKKIKYFSLS
mgnify:FL=1|jgi:UDPglucose 6-dehydrogenase